MMIEITKPYILISVWMTFMVIQDHSCTRKKNGVHFLANFSISLDEIQSLATACWFVGAHANFYFAQVLLKERTPVT